MQNPQGDLLVENAAGVYPAALDPQEFAQQAGLRFKELGLLTRALTHRSYRNEHDDALEDNERLEFLGDAVLDFLVGAWLYDHFPEMSEGELTRLRSALVRTEQLAEFANQLELGLAMRLGRGEAEGGGRQRPALLCATFEAVVGALYLDGDILVVQDFLYPLLEQATNPILEAHREQDPKSVLQEWIQARGLDHPLYRTVMSFGPDHNKVFDVEVIVNGEVYGRGEGHSKQSAAKAAARAALAKLGVE